VLVLPICKGAGDLGVGEGYAFGVIRMFCDPSFPDGPDSDIDDGASTFFDPLASFNDFNFIPGW